MSTPEPEIINDPALGAYFQVSITPDQMQGKLAWISRRIDVLTKELNEKLTFALSAKIKLDNARVEAEVQARTEIGSISKTDLTAKVDRITMKLRHDKENADLAVTLVRNELETLYKGHVPIQQSLNANLNLQQKTEYNAYGML